MYTVNGNIMSSLSLSLSLSLAADSRALPVCLPPGNNNNNLPSSHHTDSPPPPSQLLPQVHGDWVRRVAYIPHNHSFISCSACPAHSLVFSDVLKKNKSYVFRIRKVHYSMYNVCCTKKKRL